MKALRLLALVGAVVAIMMATTGCGSKGVSALTAKTRFRVATTTSLYDTGLWGYLEPRFESKFGVEMDIVYAGTGKALELGSRGDADAVVVHSRVDEEKFIADGYGLARQPFAYNYFLVVGPASDPAGIKGMGPEEAFDRLREQGATRPDVVKFVSRGDNSGTHSKEKAIWASAGVQYDTDVQDSWDWYIEAGAGMGPTLVMANEKAAYTLTDIGTFVSYKRDLGLVPVVDEGDILLNVYAAIPVKPPQGAGQLDMANNLVAFLTSDEVQDLIGQYGVEDYGMPMFMPCRGAAVCRD